MEVVDVLSGGDGVSSRWLTGRRQLSADLWVLAAGQLAWVTFPHFFFCGLWFVDCGFYDQRRARMVVTGLGGAVGFSIGLGMKYSYRAWGNIQIARAGLGLFKISWGKNLKGTIIFG